MPIAVWVMSQMFYTYEQIHLASGEARLSMNSNIQTDSLNISQQLMVSSQKQWFIVKPVRDLVWLRALSLQELTALKHQNVVMINGCFNGAAFTLWCHYGNIMFEKTVINIHYNCKLVSWMLIDCVWIASQATLPTSTTTLHAQQLLSTSANGYM